METPAHCAGRLGCREAFTALCGLGADDSLRNKWGRTPSEELEHYNNLSPVPRQSLVCSDEENRQNNEREVVSQHKARSSSEPRLRPGAREGEREARSATLSVRRDGGRAGVGGSNGAATTVNPEPQQASKTLEAQGDDHKKHRAHSDPSRTGSSHQNTHNRPTNNSSSDTDRHRHGDSGNGGGVCGGRSNCHRSQKAEQSRSTVTSPLCSKSVPHINTSSHHQTNSGGSGGASKSASCVEVPTTAGTTGTPASEHRAMKRKEAYTVTQSRGEGVAGGGREMGARRGEVGGGREMGARGGEVGGGREMVTRGGEVGGGREMVTRGGEVGGGREMAMVTRSEKLSRRPPPSSVPRPSTPDQLEGRGRSRSDNRHKRKATKQQVSLV